MKDKNITVRYVTCTDEDTTVRINGYTELIYIKSGTITLNINGKEFTLDEGKTAVTGSSEAHRITAEGNSAGYISLRFCSEELYSSVCDAILPFIFNTSSLNGVYSVPYASYLFDECLKEYNEKQIGYESVLAADTVKIITSVIRIFSDGRKTNSSDSVFGKELIESVRRITVYVSENFRNITETEAADMCGLSYSYFSRTFKKIMNMSFSQYVNKVRTDEARKLLLTTDKSITEISMELGFSTSSHFIQIFSKYTGCSPNRFRKNNQL